MLFWGCLCLLSACFKPKRRGEGRSGGDVLSGLCFCLFLALETERPVCVSSHAFGGERLYFCIFQLESFPRCSPVLGNRGSAWILRRDPETKPLTDRSNKHITVKITLDEFTTDDEGF